MNENESGKDDTQPVVAPRAAGLKRGMRLWIPAIVVGLAAANILRVRAIPDLDGMSRNMQTFATLGLSFLALVLWWMFLTRLRWRVRLSGLGVVLLCVLALKFTLRIDGSSGTGAPHVVWKWAPKRSGEVGNLPAAGTVEKASKRQNPFDYPGYLGSDRSGNVAGVSLEPDWSAHPPQELWRRPVGLGWSAFAVSGSYAFTQEQRGEDELVVCYDLVSGTPVWSHANRVRFSEPMGGDGPRATPTISHGRVFAMGATGILDCLDAATGRLVWTHDILKENGLANNPFGKSSSPLVIDDLVVVTGGMTKKSTLLAYRNGDGAPAWQAGTDEASFSSPTLATMDGKQQIVSINASSVTGHDAADGRILWEYAWANNKWPKCAQPVLLPDNRILLSASFDAGCVLLKVHSSADGKWSATELWKKRTMKSDFSNLVARDGFLYGLDDGILACVDLATGERRWKDGRYGHGQIVLAGDLLLIQSEQGPIALVEANPAKYVEVARLNALNAKTWNTPALAGDLLLVRNDQEAACYRLPKRAAVAVETRSQSTRP